MAGMHRQHNNIGHHDHHGLPHHAGGYHDPLAEMHRQHNNNMMHHDHHNHHTHPSFYYGRQQAHRPTYVLEFHGVKFFQSESLSSVFFVWIVVVLVGYNFQARRGVGGQNARGERLPEADPKKLQSLIDTLPNVDPEDGKGHSTMEDLCCGVCYDDEAVKNGGALKILPCSHHFCSDCLAQWLCKAGTCPNCRYQLSDEDFCDQRNKEAEEADHEDDSVSTRDVRIRRSKRSKRD